MCIENIVILRYNRDRFGIIVFPEILIWLNRFI